MSKSKLRTNEISDRQQYPNSDTIIGRRVTPEDIAERAYALYLARGTEDGHDVEDWLQAERELFEETGLTK
jgi:hypothetical protein